MQAPFQRIEVESAPAPRLELEQPLVTIPSLPPERPTFGLMVLGVGVLAVGFAALASVGFIEDEFARGLLSGAIALGVAVLGFGLLGAGVVRELRGLLALGRVDRLRQALAAEALSPARQAARQWLRGLSEGAEILPAIEAAESAAAIRALLRAGPLSALRLRTDALARVAAVQSFVATSAVPSPSLDGLFILWRGLRLVRQVAELHGLRPGTLATLSLLRRTAFSAAAVVTTDVAVTTALGAVTSHPLLRQIVGDVAGAGVGARRLFLLARATQVSCTPLPPA